MNWIEATVIRQQIWTVRLYSLFLEAPFFNFQAGQFALLSLNPPHSLFRAYSLVSAPQEKVVELYYTYLPQGLQTPRLKALQPGDRVWLRERPGGNFILASISDAKNLWLFASGTGLGPFISMLKTAEPWTRFDKIVLVHSVRWWQDLTHLEWVHKWQEKYPSRFNWVPIITRQKISQFFDQRMTVLLNNGQIEQHVKLQLAPHNSQVLLCGNPEMIEDMSFLLQRRQLRVSSGNIRGNVLVESYWKK